MNQKAVQWLYEQLPELVEKGIIPIESIELIRNHYGLTDKKLGGRMLLTIFGVIGSLLIGLGIILIFAHNWEQMTRMTRTVIAVGMLLATQIMVGVIIWFKKEAMVWKEGAATFLMIIMGSSIALIGQTYHLADNFSMALLVWMLLSIPLVYLMGVTTPALLYVVGVTTWVCGVEFDSIGKHFIWILLGLVGPYYWKLAKINKYGNRPVLLAWAFIISVYISFGAAFGDQLHSLSMLLYATLFGITYCVGIRWFDDSLTLWRRPFTILGFVGCAGVALVLTFRDVWWSIGHDMLSIGAVEYSLAFSLLALLLVMGRKVMMVKTKNYLLFGLVPLVAGVGYLLFYFDKSGINATILCNVYVLFLGVTGIRKGIRQGSLGVLNMGMLLVTFLITTRFFDMDFSFIARGLVFVLLGSCFLVTNWVMVRRKKEVENAKK